MAPRTRSSISAPSPCHSGEGRSLELEVRIEPFDMGGQRYALDGGTVPATLDVSHMTTRLRAAAALRGAAARTVHALPGRRGRAPIDVDAREVDQPGGGEDLTSPYVDGTSSTSPPGRATRCVLALPPQIVCSEDCLGLCAVCGENLNEAGPDHAHEARPTRAGRSSASCGSTRRLSRAA